jgi:transcriptional regulator with XRE-family HTH domain
MADKSTFSTRLRRVMLDHDMSATMLSAHTGIQPPNVSRLLHDKRDPSLATLRKIIAALPASVSVRELIMGVRDEN